MNFQNPSILYALFALIVPIIVHLFQLRKFKKTPFTNVKFLQELVLQTRKSSELKKWLLLAIRSLAYVCIIIAFAQPYIKNKTTVNKEKETVVYLDNSFSMQAKGAKGELFKVAVQEVLQHFNADEKLSVITNNKTYKNTTLAAIRNDLIATEYTAVQLPYQTIALRANKLFGQQKNIDKRLFLISDFQKNAPLDTSYFNTDFKTNFIQVLPVSVKNVSIDTAYFSRKEAANLTLKVLIKRHSSAVKSIPISLFNKDSLISKTAIVTNKQFNAIDFSLPANQNLDLKIKIQDQNFTQDNELFLIRNTPAKLNVLAIGNLENNRFLSKIFTEDEFVFAQNTAKTINYSSFEKLHVLIWNEVENPSVALLQNTKQFVKKGGVVICIPNENSNQNAYQKLTGVFSDENKNTSRLTKINFSHPIFRHVFEKKVRNFQYPSMQKHFELKNYHSEILGLENGDPFLVKKENYYIFSAALNSKHTNIKQSPIVVPVFYNIAKSSLKSDVLYYEIGNKNEIDIPITLQKDAVLHLQKGDFDFIPLQQIKANKVRIQTEMQPQEAGMYQIIGPNHKPYGKLAYNYNKKESIPQYYDLEKFTNEYIKVGQSIAKEIENVNSLYKVPFIWKWFVIFALAFLLIELLILKYFK